MCLLSPHGPQQISCYKSSFTAISSGRFFINNARKWSNHLELSQYLHSLRVYQQISSMLLRTAKTEQQRYPSCKRHTIITQKENDNIDLKTKLSILCDGRENQSFFGWEVACLWRCATFYTLLNDTSRLFADCMAVWMTCCGATVGGNGYGWTEPIVPQQHFIFRSLYQN